MGLDASVRCRCWEEGKTSTPPCPVRLDRDGWLERESSDGSLEADLVFDAWLQDACEHDQMQLACEYIGDWASYQELRQAVRSAVPRSVATLERVLPDANGGAVTAADAALCLVELTAFEKTDDARAFAPQIRPLRIVFTASVRSGNPVRWC